MIVVYLTEWKNGYHLNIVYSIIESYTFSDIYKAVISLRILQDITVESVL